MIEIARKDGSTFEVYQSRFGYHVLDCSTYMRLKQLHRRVWQTIYTNAAHRRWTRKMPHNRIRTVIKRAGDKGFPIGRTVLGPWGEPQVCDLIIRGGYLTDTAERMMEAFYEVKPPRKLEDVHEISVTPHEVMRFHDEVEKWFEMQKMSPVNLNSPTAKAEWLAGLKQRLNHRRTPPSSVALFDQTAQLP